ncbi:hypothetical protein SUDANB120_00043 [Streptomyces sp. enrichment culture]|uniref:hypothetical protein n=1 Tax=Streptomyces sp. enrichment culture TaxID=1795815 RepID=UPI003F5537FD
MNEQATAPARPQTSPTTWAAGQAGGRRPGRRYGGLRGQEEGMSPVGADTLACAAARNPATPTPRHRSRIAISTAMSEWPGKARIASRTGPSGIVAFSR